MKKRFTLMMMVLCFLMSIPLKMMAETVTIHFVDKESTKWESYAAYVYDRTITGNGSQPWVTDKWPGQKVTNSADIETLANGYKVVTWKIDLKSCALSNALVIFNNQDNGKQCPASGQPGKEVKNGYYYYSDGSMSATAPSGTETGGGSGTGGSGSTTEEWNTVTTNRLTGKKYTQGFYLAGNFFTFDTDGINYDDAVFKFQQQKDINESARTAYDLYMVEIPASLTAKAQLMYVNENGEKTGIFGPGTANKIIDKDFPATGKSTEWANPTTGQSTEWAGITPNESTNLFDKTKNYWDFFSRNVSKSEYSDGLYKVYIAVEKNTHEPKMWKITHIADKRVAYFLSNTPDATAMPLYDTYKLKDRDTNPQFYNNFFGTVNFSANRSYYVISNYIYNNGTVDKAKDYGTILDFYLERIPSPTTNKLFLQGNGGLDFTGSDPDNLICPNLAPLKVGKNYWGTRIVEYNPSRGKTNVHGTPFGFCGDLMLRSDRAVLTSVSLVGDAIPGTLNANGTWNYKSNVADMVYDETEQCYKARVVTAKEAYGKPFRFVGNHDQKITWYENTNSDKNEMAKCPYDSDDPQVLGHTAGANDPNKVDYNEKGDPTSEDYNSWNIIWNRPAGRWTVRLYFNTYSDGDKPVTDYYYTITENRDMELHDVGDVVYGSLDNKQIITNLDGYKFMRTWSAQKAWKISDKVDIFVVSKIADDESGVVKMTLTKINGDETGVYNVIPAYTGVILATKSDASEIPGAKFKSREDFTSYNNLVIPMEQYDTDVKYNGINKLEPILVSRVIPSFENDKYNYLFGYYNTQIATGDKIKHEANEYLLGFWISKGSKPYSSNSSYLPIDKVTAAKMKYLGTSSKDYVTGGGSSAKKAPGVIFDFTNVGGTTGINEVVNQSAKLNDGKYYTLSGQQVEKPTAGGIYIHNGRKFVVK